MRRSSGNTGKRSKVKDIDQYDQVNLDIDFDAIDQLDGQRNGHNGAGQVDPMMYAQRVATDKTVNNAERAATVQSTTFVVRT